MHRHAAVRDLLATGVDVLHVGAHLRDIHPAVAVENGHRRLLNLRLAQDQFDAIARRQLKKLLAVGRREKRRARHRWQRRRGCRLGRFRRLGRADCGGARFVLRGAGEPGECQN